MTANARTDGMRFIIIALFLAGLAAAFSVMPDYRGIKDTGSDSLPALDVRMTIDCDSKNITVDVRSNETDLPVEGASTYLFYTDYEYQPLPNPGKTNAQGVAVNTVPGTLKFLTALFIMRVDKTGFQSREIEFTYEKCFQAPPPPPEPEEDDTEGETGGGLDYGGGETAPPVQPPAQNATQPGQNVTPPAQDTEPPVGDVAPPPGDVPPGPCPAAALLMAAAAVLAVRR